MTLARDLEDDLQGVFSVGIQMMRLHSHQFHQIEGLVVGKNISMADLQGTLQLIVQKMFGAERQIRLRPSYFPFTEPSVEVDVSCFKCGGAGCNVCKKTGWIEIMGAGMVHPRVLEMSGIDATVYSGFAFGLGQGACSHASLWHQ